MFSLEKIGLNLSFPPFYFFLVLILLAAYAVYVYRYTVPQISLPRKIFLTVLRSLALILLLFVFFEPVLTLARKKVLEPVNMIFADNSRSIRINDGTNREKTVKDFLHGLKPAGLTGNSKLFTFGTKVAPLAYDSLSKIDFSEGSTDLSNIFSYLGKSQQNIASIVLVSDGVITQGTNPLHTAEKLGIPVYTIGVGDTAARNDISVKDALYNELIYAQTPTTIVASIANTGFTGTQITAALFENDVQVDKQNVSLSSDGIQNVSFTYTPKSGGEKKLAVVLSKTPGEFNYANNKKVFYVNVLSNKVKVLLITGSPSSDAAFIKNALREDKNLTVNSITQFAPDKFIEKNDRQKLIDSANVIFLAGFPSKDTPPDLLQRVMKAISTNDKPYFIVLSPGVDFTKLKLLQSELPFTIGNVSNDYLEIQPEISADQSDNALLQNNAPDPISAWNNLPPVLQPNVAMNPKPESQIISKVTINNVPMNRPLILTRRLGSKKSIAVLAADIWRWKLETAPKDLDLFDRFILASVKWLNTKEDHKQVSIKTGKKLYSLGEQVGFSAQVYDQSFNPVSDAEVKVNVKSGSESYTVNLNSIGSGLYEGSFQTSKAGDYTFSGDALQDHKKLGSDNGSFNIGEVDIEMLNTRMNYDFLSLLSNQTGGKFFYNSNYRQLYSILKDLDKRSSKNKIEISDVSLWSNEWLLAAAILLFGLEWFFRKRFGMI